MEITGNYLILVNIIIKISEKYNKHYCFPSQKKLLQLLCKINNINRSLSTLNRWLRVIEDQKLIKRVRRLKRQPDNSIHFRSTLYFVTKKATMTLHRSGFDVWDILSKWWENSKRLREKAAAARDDIGEELISYSEFKRRLALQADAMAPV